MYYIINLHILYNLFKNKIKLNKKDNENNEIKYLIRRIDSSSIVIFWWRSKNIVKLKVLL